MVTNEAYLTPTELRPVVAALVNQVATWDNVEQTWEIMIPVKVAIHTPYEKDGDYFDDLLQFHDWAGQNGVEYSYTQPDRTNNVLSVVGLHI